MPLTVDFQRWLRAVDLAIEAKTGLSRDDLPDCPYADWYQQGIQPSSAANRAIRYAATC